MSEKIRNVGGKSALWLRQVGVRSLDDLRSAGVIDTFMRVKRAGFKPSLNLLYSLQGAIDDCHWKEIDPVKKAELIEAVGLEDAKLAKNPRRLISASAVTTYGSDGEEVAEGSFDPGLFDSAESGDSGGGGASDGGSDNGGAGGDD
jgi:DNA transformation protein